VRVPEQTEAIVARGSRHNVGLANKSYSGNPASRMLSATFFHARLEGTIVTPCPFQNHYPSERTLAAPAPPLVGKPTERRLERWRSSSSWRRSSCASAHHVTEKVGLIRRIWAPACFPSSGWPPLIRYEGDHLRCAHCLPGHERHPALSQRVSRRLPCPYKQSWNCFRPPSDVKCWTGS
jgi:hypothetical protein